MTTTETPTLPLESFPARGARPSMRPGTRTALTGFAAVLAAVPAAIGLFAVIVVGLAQLVRVPPPDTSDDLDPLLAAAGLHETWRQGTDGDSLFDHPASLTVDADGPTASGEPVSVGLYRAAAARGWVSTGGVTTATCTDQDPRFAATDAVSTSRYDDLEAPDGQTVEVSWETAGAGADSVSFELDTDPGDA